MKMSLKFRLICTGATAVFVWSLLFWDNAHGGVPVHHLLAREDMPGFSNWWGGILIPALCWFLTFRTTQRFQGKTIPTSVVYEFAGSLLYGILLCLTFEMGIKDVPLYMLLAWIASSLFLPIYNSTFFLGLVIGMVYTFGGVLPIIVVSVLSLVAFAVHKLIRPAVLFCVVKAGRLVRR